MGLQEQIKPTGYFYASNASGAAVVLDGALDHTDMLFYNQGLGGALALSASNQALTVSSGGTKIARFQLDSASRPTLDVEGVVATKQLIVKEAFGAKSVVLRDFNELTSSQFAGFGYSNGFLNYQLPGGNATHAFYTAVNGDANVELVRIGRNASSGSAQVGIGTSVFDSPATALQVAGAARVMGDATVDGNLYVRGTFGFDIDNVPGLVRLNAANQIDSTYLPSNYLALNAANQVDDSYLPHQYSFQYLRSGKNVGIGTRYPQQKLHVNGTAVVGPRLGVGTIVPASTLHVYQSNVVSPMVFLQCALPTSPLAIEVAGRQVLNVDARGNLGVGTGSNIMAGYNGLRVAGNLRVDGAFDFGNIAVQALEWNDGGNIKYFHNSAITLADHTRQEVLECRVPFITTSYVAASRLVPAAPDSNVHFTSCGIVVDGTATFNGPVIYNTTVVQTTVTVQNTSSSSVSANTISTCNLTSPTNTIDFGYGVASNLSSVQATSFSGTLLGNAASATRLAAPITLALAGAVGGSVTLAGNANVTLSTTLNASYIAAALSNVPVSLAGPLSVASNLSVGASGSAISTLRFGSVSVDATTAVGANFVGQAAVPLAPAMPNAGYHVWVTANDNGAPQVVCTTTSTHTAYGFIVNVYRVGAQVGAASTVNVSWQVIA
jgi:hypothetical protein